MAATPTGHGYWLVATDGGIFSYGDAKFYGSTGGIRLNQPIVAMASTPKRAGLLADRVTVACSPSATRSSTARPAAIHLNKPIVGAAATASGHGYWFVAADGGIFSFGDAAFKGSTAAAHLSARIVGMAATRNGYLLLGANGHVFNFGSAKNYGSASNSCSGAPPSRSRPRPTRSATGSPSPTRRPTRSRRCRARPHCAPAKKPAIGGAAADLFVRMNDERRARGLAPLVWNTTLAAYASNWSRTMGASEPPPQRHRPAPRRVRLRRREHRHGSGGVPASALHLAWMHSQDHRDNILSPGFQSAGIGVYCAPDGSIWATTEFARPSSAGPPPPYSANTPSEPVARTDSGTAGC